MKLSRLFPLFALTLGTAGSAHAGPDELLTGFRATQSSLNIYGVSVGAYTGSFDGVNTFDVYCVDYLHDIYGRPYSVYRIGSVGSKVDDGSLSRSRLGVLHGDVGTAHDDNYANYLKAAYLSNKLREVTNAGDIHTLAGIHLALWSFTAYQANGLILNPTAEEDMGNGLKARYSVNTDNWMGYRDNANSCIDLGIGCDASWDPSRWYLLTDSKWTDVPLCATGEDTRRCKQEFLTYIAPVPEPATMGLLAGGLVVMSAAGLMRRRRRA